MEPEKLTQEEKLILLRIARQALEAGVRRVPLLQVNMSSLPEILQEEGASFITLTINGELRGCIGALLPYQPLVEDVREHAVAAALEDYRFPPVRENELSKIKIEISRLTTPTPLEYLDPSDLITKLRPGIDGVILRDGFRRATFLPQVWGKITDPPDFLANLCFKMGAAPDTWKRKHLDVLTYQVEEFHEST